MEKCLALLTFLPMDEVRRLAKLEGSQINEAKKVLAFECTKLVHGEEEAQKAMLAAAALFGGGAAAEVPTFELTRAQLEEDNRLTTVLHLCGLCQSRGDARKQVQQGAVLMGDSKVDSIDKTLSADEFGTDGILLRKGKKNYCRVVLK